MIFVWLKFLACAAIIFFAGSKLTKYGDAIAEKTGLCRAWVGLVLLAVVTSLPELANSISAVAIAKVPDLSVGNILGACMINVFTLAILDLVLWLRKKESIFIRPRESNLLSTLFGFAMLVFVAFSLAMSQAHFDFSVLGVSIYAIIILIVYFVAQRYIFVHSRGEKLIVEDQEYAHISNLQTYTYFIILALIVIVVGSWLPFIGGEIVAAMGWGETFVAVLFLGIATTLPELTVSFTALRLGERGMAVGNLIGSNIFNLAILFLADVFYQPGILLAAVSPNMIYAAGAGALLMGLAYFSLKKQISNRFASFVIIFIYLASLFFLFQAGAAF